MRTERRLSRVWCVPKVSAAVIGCTFVVPSWAQDTDPHIDRLEAIAWEAAGGREGRANRWSELTALFADARQIREAADKEVDELVPDDGGFPIDGIDLGFYFSMVGDLDWYEHDFERDRYAYSEAGLETIPKRRAMFRAAEAVYIRMLDGMDEVGLIDRLRELRDSDAAFVPIPDERTALRYSAVMLESLSEFRKLTQMLDRRMLVAAEREDWERYIDDLESMLWHAEVSTCSRLVTAHVYGIAGQAVMYKRIRQDIVGKPVPSETLERVAELLDEAKPIRFVDLLAGERVMLSVFLDELYDDAGRIRPDQVESLFWVHDLFAPEGDEAPSIDEVDFESMPTRAEVEAKAEELWLAFAAEVNAPASERWQSQTDAEALTAGWDRVDKLAAIVIPALLESERSHLQIALQTRGVKALLAIERYRRGQGRLPDSLDELVPGYLDRVTPDPLNADRPLGYARDDSELGYVLYSVGADGVDDGGNASERLYDAFSPDASGVDFVFTSPNW